MTDTQQDQDAVLFATRMTADNLRELVKREQSAVDIGEHSIIAITERDELIGQVSQILPAGNVVNFIFSGMVNIKDREISSDESSLHLRSLMKGLQTLRDNTY